MGRTSGGVRAAKRIESKMSATQKVVFDQLVNAGVDKRYAAYTVGKSWANAFREQPMQYIQGVLAERLIRRKDEINSLLNQRVNRMMLAKVLSSIE